MVRVTKILAKSTNEPPENEHVFPLKILVVEIYIKMPFLGNPIFRGFMVVGIPSLTTLLQSRCEIALARRDDRTDARCVPKRTKQISLLCIQRDTTCANLQFHLQQKFCVHSPLLKISNINQHDLHTLLTNRCLGFRTDATLLTGAVRFPFSLTTAWRGRRRSSVPLLRGLGRRGTGLALAA